MNGFKNNLAVLFACFFNIFFDCLLLFGVVWGIIIAPFALKGSVIWMYGVVPGVFFLSALLNEWVGVGHHFDKKFKKTLTEDPMITEKISSFLLPATWSIQLRFTRTTQYIKGLLLGKEKMSKNVVLASWFGSFDFKKEATALDVILGYLFLFSAIVFITTVVISGVMRFVH